MSKHSLSEKLNLVSQVHKGKPIKRLSKDSHIREGMLLEWVRKYDLYGEVGLQKQPNIRATSDFKEEVVRLIMEKHLPLAQVVLPYGVSRSSLESWIRMVKANGYSSLAQQKKRGRPSTSMGRAKKHVPETALEKLQGENARLRAENSLLKKVKALVEEREARERMSGQQPSKDSY
ncbi:hypothetical protein EZS27_020002 [termite gut metagenome]|uniref:Transposase n=1 Tax=termite gut metagenome TaxID=433724 RepID=A0A5J4RBN5_9ZZZZ